MSTAARKARKRAGEKFQHPVKTGTPFDQRSKTIWRRDYLARKIAKNLGPALLIDAAERRQREREGVLVLGEVRVAPTGTQWTVTHVNEGPADVTVLVRVRSAGGATRWLPRAEVATWPPADVFEVNDFKKEKK